MNETISKEFKIRLGWKIFFLLGLVIAVIFLYLRISDYPEAARLKTIEDGNAIIAALDSYFSKNGKYPDSLELLAPDYIDKIKKPKWGEDGWIYKFGDPNYFRITVGYKDWGESYYPVMYYSSAQKEVGWIYDN